MSTIFKRIIDRQIPAEIIFEDEHCLAFKDIHPQAPTHVLVIPKKEIASLEHASVEDQALLGHLLVKTAEIARKLGLNKNGYRVAINTGDEGGQTVHHLHLHLLGGRALGWPPG